MQLYQRPEILLEIPESIEFLSDIFYKNHSTNIRQSLHLMKPKEQNKKLPLIIYIHGGAWNHGDKDLQVPHLIPYVESGEYITVALNYRFSQHAPWPAQIEDCTAALNHLIENADLYGVDSDRIAVWGSSSGAHLSLHMVNDSRIQATVAYCAPSHFHPLLDILEAEEHSLKSHTLPDSPVIHLIGCDPVEEPYKLLDASPYEHLSEEACPLLLAHGTEDEAVPYEQSLAIKEKSTILGVPCHLITMDGHGHKFIHPKLDSEVKNFFDYHLLKRGNPPKDLSIS
ncbi:alpha/beta hydrolase [Lentisphaera marina]|uniref:alpha/beta hydrolase n=1 Tax=Lentisphaera marina TaxID=1111041 RepID=UPI0023664390|nr:alpha/beta hydrolase [Lentisphaera marina]MDD7986269.1 alpha/beta hydrolase [Lentisphaera marina]